MQRADVRGRRAASEPITAPMNHLQRSRANFYEKAFSVALESDRGNILSLLEACRQFIVGLELTRMRKSRIGYHSWFDAWCGYYSGFVFNRLRKLVANWIPLFNRVFKTVFGELCLLIRQIGYDAEMAESPGDIARLMEQLHSKLYLLCEKRRRTALILIREIKTSIDSLPILMPDNVYEELKRCVFGVTGDGNYYTGDDNHLTPYGSVREMTLEHDITGFDSFWPPEYEPPLEPLSSRAVLRGQLRRQGTDLSEASIGSYNVAAELGPFAG